MTTQPQPDAFRAAVSQQLAVGDLRSEVMRHEMSATVNRMRLTKGDEAINSLNTTQLMWMLIGQDPSSITPQMQVVQGLIASAVIDDQEALVEAAEQYEMIIPSWKGWWDKARSFQGSSEKLNAFLASIRDIRSWGVAACLATKHCPKAINESILRTSHTQWLALVWRQIAERALAHSPPTAITNFIFQQIHDDPAIMMTRDSDTFLASLIRAHQGSDIESKMKPIITLMGHQARVALASRAIDEQRWDRALELVKPIGLLSEVFSTSCTIRALAYLGKRAFGPALKASAGIEEVATRLMMEVRIAQESNDLSQEEQALSKLMQITPKDPAAFIQHLLCLQKQGKQEALRSHALQCMERFMDYPEVKSFIEKQILTRGDTSLSATFAPRPSQG
ncbi:MAG: hypothetical protein EA401_13090 [Planctomycetota bacterium]|nr:MAG: hypothetical protein EA401_13090 [Planctomycetota bacterium]